MQKEQLTTPRGTICFIRRHARAKYIRITVRSRDNIFITIPKRASLKTAQHFINEKEAWIEEQVIRLEQRVLKKPWQGTTTEYKDSKEVAKEIVEKKVEFLNRHYEFNFNRISIKNQQTVWGSCSHKGNLNFSYRCIFLPEECLDYIIIHELCHLQELNHGPRFWNLVEQMVPNHKNIRKQLRKYE